MQTLQNPPSPSNSPLPPYLLSKLRYSKIRVHLRSSSPQKRAGGHFPSLSRLFLHNPRPLLILALFCNILLYLPHCGNLPEPPGSTPIEGKAPNQPPPPQPPPGPPPDRPIFLWVTSCQVAGDMDRARHQAWETNTMPGSCISTLLVPEPCPGAANADGRNAAHDICAGAYTGILFNPCTSMDMSGRSALEDDQRINIEANIPSNLRHRAVINTGGGSLNAAAIIPTGPDREFRTVRRPDDTLITNNWRDFFDASETLRNTIEAGPAPGDPYWTGIDIMGSSFSGSSQHCNNWRNTTGNGNQGRSALAGDDRLNGVARACSGNISLLCASFEGP